MSRIDVVIVRTKDKFYSDSDVNLERICIP